MRLQFPIFMFAILALLGAGADTTKIHVAEPSGIARRGWPVTSGIPFARGSLKDGQVVALFTTAGNEVPLQTEVLARWPGGSVRWLLIDFQVTLAAGERKELLLRYGNGVRRGLLTESVRVHKQNGQTTIHTGPLRLELRPHGFDLLNSAWLDMNGDGKVASDERITGPEPSGIAVADSSSKKFLAADAPAEISIEQAGPLRACVRVTGRHASADGHMFRYVVRIQAFRGQPFVRMFYTFVNDHQDSLMAKIRALNLVFRLVTEEGPGKYGVVDEKETEGRLFQLDESHYELNGKPSDGPAAGWGAVGGENAGLAVGVREFWQNWPKGITVQPEALTIGICPELREDIYAGKPLEEENKLYYHVRDGFHTFKIGVARTHELWTTFFA